MKQIINSGWKEFDRQTNCITTGNAYCNTQYSSYIRPYKETECNGFVKPQGELLAWDLQQYRRFRIPEAIEEVLRDKNREKSVILYMFFITNKEGRVEPFSWVLTDYDHNLITYRLAVRWGQSYNKRMLATHEALKYITN